MRSKSPRLADQARGSSYEPPRPAAGRDRNHDASALIERLSPQGDTIWRETRDRPDDSRRRTSCVCGVSSGVEQGASPATKAPMTAGDQPRPPTVPPSNTNAERQRRPGALSAGDPPDRLEEPGCEANSPTATIRRPPTRATVPTVPITNRAPPTTRAITTVRSRQTRMRASSAAAAPGLFDLTARHHPQLPEDPRAVRSRGARGRSTEAPEEEGIPKSAPRALCPATPPTRGTATASHTTDSAEPPHRTQFSKIPICVPTSASSK